MVCGNANRLFPHLRSLPQSDAFSFAKEALDSSESKEEKDVSAHIKVSSEFTRYTS